MKGYKYSPECQIQFHVRSWRAYHCSLKMSHWSSDFFFQYFEAVPVAILNGRMMRPTSTLHFADETCKTWVEYHLFIQNVTILHQDLGVFEGFTFFFTTQDFSCPCCKAPWKVDFFYPLYNSLYISSTNLKFPSAIKQKVKYHLL